MNKNKYAYIHDIAIGDKLFNIDSLKLYTVKSMFNDKLGNNLTIIAENDLTGEERKFSSAAVKETMVNITNALNAGLDLADKDSIFLSRDNITNHLKGKNRMNAIYTRPKFNVLMLVRNFLESHRKMMISKHCYNFGTTGKGISEHH